MLVLELKKGIGPEDCVSINFGRNERKNNDTLGFVRLVKMPWHIS